MTSRLPAAMSHAYSTSAWKLFQAAFKYPPARNFPTRRKVSVFALHQNPTKRQQVLLRKGLRVQWHRWNSSKQANTQGSSSNGRLSQPPMHRRQPPHNHNESGGDDDFRFYGILLARGLMAWGMIHCFHEYVAEITLCEGPSMLPTIEPHGEIVLIDKWTLRRLHKKGDSEAVCHGETRTNLSLERQAAYEKMDPNHVDQWHEPRISVSDLDPSQQSWRMLWTLLTTPLSIGDVVVLQNPNRRGTICKRVLGLPGDVVVRPIGGLLVIPDGHVWVEGDNKVNSSDSRSYGHVPLTLIQGRVLCRVWPLRGNAVMARGMPPRHHYSYYGSSDGGFTVLPAGYGGQHIVKKPPSAAASRASPSRKVQA